MKIFQFFEISVILCLGNYLFTSTTLSLVRADFTTIPTEDQLQGLSVFARGLITSFANPIKNVPAAVLKDKVLGQMVRAADSLNLPNPENDTCQKNYSILCPEKWTDSGDGESCLAPLDYAGPCGHKMSLRNATPLSKFNFEVTCEVDWPCLNSCVQDFARPCPDQWVQLYEGSCEAPKSYRGKCVRSKNFQNYSEADKKLWAETCDANWPCVDKQFDFGFLCPVHWRMNPDEKTCSAPETYLGPCPADLYLFGATDHEKSHLMERCGIEWPIRGNDTVFDFDAVCPLGWKLINSASATCEAPVAYAGPCPKITSFQFYSKEEKYHFSKRCEAPWKSADQKIQNFKLPCPYRWELIDEQEQLCLAPVEYRGPCENLFAFKNYSVEMKAAWSVACATVFLAESSFVLYKINQQRNVPVSGARRGSRIRDLGATDAQSKGFVKLTDHEGPIGLPRTASHGKVVTANEQNRISSILKRNKDGSDEIMDLSDIASVKAQQLIVSDDKIRDLNVLKESSDDEEFKRTIDQTIADLKKRNAKLVPFAFIQINKMRDVDVIEESVDIVKNLYENYKIERGSLSYDGSCEERDYSKCPVGWTKLSNVCLAPRSYIRTQRKCPSILNIEGLNKKVYDVTHGLMIDMADIQARKKLEIDCALTFPCKECLRDAVRVHCPLGWAFDASRESCQAPSDYPEHLRELCGDSVSFKHATPAFKRNWGYQCRADWPCFSVCEKNYGAVCPIGYKVINERTEEGETVHVCVDELRQIERMERPEDVSGQNLCPVIEVLASPVMKKEIEKECKVQWPCLEKCEEDYYQSCPYDWIFHGNRCLAPFHYAPPRGCARSFDVAAFSEHDKFLFSIKCFAPWPCKDSCQPDLRAVCPQGWDRVSVVKSEMEEEESAEMEEEKSAEMEEEKSADMEKKSAETNIVASIGDDTDASNGPKAGRARTAPEPTEEALMEAYKSLEKKKDTKFHTCKAPPMYQGPCSGTYDFENFTFLQKQEFAFRCSVHWPCGKSVHHLPNWQRPEVYKDTNFENLHTVRFSNPQYLLEYNKYMQMFVN